MKTITKILMAAFAAAALAPVTVLADAGNASNQGYLIDSWGTPVTSGTPGVCWHTTNWTAAGAVQGCDPVAKPVAVAPLSPPIVVAAAPVAAPVAAPAPQATPTQVTQKITFSGDALFAFDQSDLKPEGKAMLDELVRKIDGARYETILATGHTDRFGSAAYNQKLSERRAIAVKDYLMSKNVPANRIEAQGMGQTQPMTKAGDCRGAKSASVVSCLQPDRRVDVEMTGTQIVTGSL